MTKVLLIVRKWQVYQLQPSLKENVPFPHDSRDSCDLFHSESRPERPRVAK